MRILHVYKDVYPPVVGGIERHIDSIRAALPELRHDVIVCARAPRTRSVRSPSGREVLVGELGRVLSTPIAPTFPLWLRRTAAGATVHLHMPNPTGELSSLIRPASSPMVATYHADVYRQRWLLPVYAPLILRCLRSAQAVVTASSSLKHGSPILRRAQVPVDVVPFGIDIDRWAPGRSDQRLVASLRERYGPDHVLSIGRLVMYKGFDYLIRAAAELSSPVVIIGEGPARADLERLIRERRLEGRVHLVGQVDDDRLAAHLEAASVFVLPSTNRAEAFGIALLEAQAAGLPVIATDTGVGTSEAFDPGRSGLIVPAADVRALRDAIRELMTDPERRSDMATAGRRRVREQNSLERLGERLRAVYERAARAHSQRS